MNNHSISARFFFFFPSLLIFFSVPWHFQAYIPFSFPTLERVEPTIFNRPAITIHQQTNSRVGAVVLLFFFQQLVVICLFHFFLYWECHFTLKYKYIELFSTLAPHAWIDMGKLVSDREETAISFDSYIIFLLENKDKTSKTPSAKHYSHCHKNVRRFEYIKMQCYFPSRLCNL